MKRLNIHIHKLGPVRNAKIELAPVMIFTGASNLGKSYTNFLTYYIFNLFSGDRLTDFFRARMPEEANAGTASFSFSAKELEAWMEQDVRNFFAYLLNYPDVPCKVEFCFDNTDTAFQVKVKQAQMPGKADFGNFIILSSFQGMTKLQRIRQGISPDTCRKHCWTYTSTDPICSPPPGKGFFAERELFRELPVN